MTVARAARIDEELAPLRGDAAIPRDNGEPIFSEPWEATSFGLAVSLTDQGLLSWESFRQNLIKAINASEGCEAYYESWTKALRASVVEAGILSDVDIERLESSLQVPH